MRPTEDPISEPAIFWDILLQLIAEGRVIPVVGRDALMVADEGRAQLLYPHLAEKLALSLEVPASDLPEGNELNEVACRYIAANKPVDDYPPGRTRWPSSRISRTIRRFRTR